MLADFEVQLIPQAVPDFLDKALVEGVPYVADDFINAVANKPFIPVPDKMVHVRILEDFPAPFAGVVHGYWIFLNDVLAGEAVADIILNKVSIQYLDFLHSHPQKACRLSPVMW